MKERIAITPRPKILHVTSLCTGVKPVTVTADVDTKKLSTKLIFWLEFTEIGRNNISVPSPIKALSP